MEMMELEKEAADNARGYTTLKEPKEAIAFLNERTRPQNAEVYTKTEQNTHTHMLVSVWVQMFQGRLQKGVGGVAVQHLQLSTRQPDLDVEFITGLD